jgi:hypothetical protein
MNQGCEQVLSFAQQLHGAIGLTVDYDLQLYTRRAKAAQAIFGDTDFFDGRLDPGFDADLREVGGLLDDLAFAALDLLGSTIDDLKGDLEIAREIQFGLIPGEPFIRDRIGIKPLYYTVTDGQFIFGSEIKAILQHPSVLPGA